MLDQKKNNNLFDGTKIITQINAEWVHEITFQSCFHFSLFCILSAFVTHLFWRKNVSLYMYVAP